MKKIIITLLVGLMINLIKAQTLYTGLNKYQNAGVSTQLSDGLQTKLNSNGFLMEGFIPTVTSGNDNLYIIKVDVDAVFNSTPSEFSNGYNLQTGGINCNPGLSYETSCYGATIKETYVASSVNPLVPAALWYVTAGAYDSGCLFAGLDAAGNVSTSAFFPFGLSVTSHSKPLITESVTNPGTFFIAGSFLNGTMRTMYVLHVDAAGTILWSKLYDAGPTAKLEPKAIVESPYTGSGSGLAIVGMVDLNTSVQKEGFFALLDYNNNGWANVFNTYGDGTNTTDDYFSSICIASSNSPGSTGYVIGGYTEQNVSNGRAWLTKIDPTGTVIWSTRAKPLRNSAAGDIVGVVERWSSFYSQYEYYAATTSYYGFLVLKFDNAGNYFTQSGNPFNEFYYQSTSLPTDISLPVAISFADNSSVNDGIHIYGTNVNTGVGEFMLAQAVFNGRGGGDPSASTPCMNNYISLYAMNSSNMYTGPSTINTPGYNINNGLQSCNNYLFTQANISSVITAVCDYTNAITNTGNLLKGASSNDLKESEITEYKIGPNPLSSDRILNLNLESSNLEEIELINPLGQLVKKWKVELLNDKSTLHQLSLSDVDLSPGVYLLRLNDSNKSTKNVKLIVE